MTTDELRRLFPNASASTLRRNSEADPERPRASEPQPTQGRALVGAHKGKAKSATSRQVRYRITITVFAKRPCDFDNYHVKEIIDALITCGWLPGDDWRTLEGAVRSEKSDDERTEILLEVVS